MMKYYGLGMAVIAALSACTAAPEAKQEEPQAIGMANPASVFCVEQGGKLVAKKDTQGNEYAMCHLPDGKIVEEWDYYRQKHQK
ncbi:putative hemolysin [Neisseria perflava]|uniref:putative hemolysin n=1 Tax=Neisseria perflava TaxID=33053 RepID=UPI00209CE49B|nr:DUF333 domain-containing protein [Neisseria perflava]MCP1659506.1 putative hemolysin [Neisseria perflava]MCP1772542.1 putative hemolysin [Neisseria perflava]